MWEALAQTVLQIYNAISTEITKTSGSAMAEGQRDALSVEILQLQNIPFEN